MMLILLGVREIFVPQSETGAQKLGGNGGKQKQLINSWPWTTGGNQPAVDGVTGRRRRLQKDVVLPLLLPVEVVALEEGLPELDLRHLWPQEVGRGFFSPTPGEGGAMCYVPCAMCHVLCAMPCAMGCRSIVGTLPKGVPVQANFPLKMTVCRPPVQGGG